MPAFSKKTISEDEDSDDMGTTKQQQIQNKKSTTKKRKRNNTKQEEEVEDRASVVPTTTTIITSPPNNHNEPEKKKMKKEKKPKQKATPKKKAPLDLDRQCGVLISPNNNPCTRSLTCKIHAMGAKRAVEGRSQPFNELLAAYQKKGIGRPQVPGTVNDKESTTKSKVDNNKPTKTSNSSSHQPSINTTTHKKTAAHSNNLASTVNPIQMTKEEDPDIDSDEETESVRIAIEQTKPMPLGTKQLFYVRRKRKYYKLRDILLEAITPKDSSSATTGATTTNLSAGEVTLDQISY